MDVRHSEDAPGVSVADVVEQLEMVSDGVDVFLDLWTWAFVTVFDPAIFGDEVTADQPDPDDLDSARYVPLPSSFEIHEWAVLRDFCERIEDPDLRRRALRAVHGTGAFRKAKDLLHDHGLIDDWFAARQRALEGIARDWLSSIGRGPSVDDEPPA